MPMVYFKPLTRRGGDPPGRFKVKLLHKMGEYAVEEIRNEINRSQLENKAEVKKSLKYKVMPSSVTLYSDHPTFKYLVQGVKPHVMVYIKNRVVPIDVADAKNLTIRDIRQGVAFRTMPVAPLHPGIKPMLIVRRGIKNARKRIMEDIVNEIWEQGV